VRELQVERGRLAATATLAPPRPRHEVIVLVDELDKALVNALGYARTLRPLLLTALHVAVDPAHADALADRWAQLELDVPLEVVACPHRDLTGTVRRLLTERTRPDTAVTVLIPQHRYGGLLDRVLHDRTAQRLLHAIQDLDEVYVSVVPYLVGPRHHRADQPAVPAASRATVASIPRREPPGDRTGRQPAAA
jgi:hypothetical protein